MFWKAVFWESKLGSGNQPQPQCGFAQERNSCLVLISPTAPHRAKEGLACLWLRGPCCLVGARRGLKPTPKVISYGEKADWAGIGLVCTGPRDTPLRQLGREPDRARPQTRYKPRFGKLHSANLKCDRGTILSPNMSRLRKATLLLFSPSPLFPIGPRRFSAASGSVGPAAWWVVSPA